MRLLVAENDPALATFLQESFDHEHYTVDLTHESEEAKKWVEERDYDLAILDLNLARDDGTQVLQYARAKRRELPILVLSGRNRAEDRVQILDLGADDLVLKPFSFSELSARVRALLRRGGRAVETVLCIEDLELNRVEHSVKRAGRAIELTPKEFGLLEYLMRNAGQRVTRAQIIEHVWNLSFDTMFAFFVSFFIPPRKLTNEKPASSPWPFRWPSSRWASSTLPAPKWRWRVPIPRRLPTCRSSKTSSACRTWASCPPRR